MIFIRIRNSVWRDSEVHQKPPATGSYPMQFHSPTDSCIMHFNMSTIYTYMSEEVCPRRIPNYKMWVQYMTYLFHSFFKHILFSNITHVLIFIWSVYRWLHLSGYLLHQEYCTWVSKKRYPKPAMKALTPSYVPQTIFHAIKVNNITATCLMVSYIHNTNMVAIWTSEVVMPLASFHLRLRQNLYWGCIHNWN